MNNSDEKMSEEAIARARKGTTKAKRLQCYVNDDLYDWFKELQAEMGLNESQTVKLCLRHVRVEHGMQERGRARALESHTIDPDKIAVLSGGHG